jgi:hypothetical protein
MEPEWGLCRVIFVDGVWRRANQSQLGPVLDWILDISMSNTTFEVIRQMVPINGSKRA